MGTSYGGFVVYHMAVMCPERVEKVVIASSAVNMRRRDNDRLLNEAKVDKIEDLLMPTTAAGLRTLLGFVLFRRPYMPDFLLNDILDVRESLQFYVWNYLFFLVIEKMQFNFLIICVYILIHIVPIIIHI